MDKQLYTDYLNILKEELLPAMGCTEPIAVAYAAALARSALGAIPDEVEIIVSGNILKNVKSVIVPSTDGLKGVNSAAAAGIVAGREDLKLEVLSKLTKADIENIKAFLKSAKICVGQSASGCVFDIAVKVTKGKDSAYARLEGHHTNVVEVSKNGKKLVEGSTTSGADAGMTGRDCLSVKNILEFANTVELGDIEGLINRQLELNLAISDEGLKNEYGARVGKIMLSSFGDGVHNRARAAAAAGSDARMNGCSLPVVIVSGSGNQGITASVPVAIYAKELGVSKEKLVRAVALADLITVHLKTGIGRLSAYCGAVSAGAGAGAGIAYLHGGGFEEIAHTIVNALAITSGLICDGAKSSCAAKIASAVDAGIIGFEMFRHGSQFYGGDGILTHGVENTIENVSDLARIGMKETDEEIIRIMLGSQK